MKDADSLLDRRNRALVRLDQGHRALMASLAGLDAEEAFLGSRWSVREVLLHLDSESFVDALEKIARGEQDMLPPFSSREEQLQKEIDHLGDTHRRFRDLVSGLTAEQLGQPVTPPNPINSFPGLTLLELVERVSGHEATHSRQIELTRKYVDAFRSKERAVSVITLGDGSPQRLSEGVRGLLNQADYVGWYSGCPCRSPANGPGCGIDHHRRERRRDRLPAGPGSSRRDLGSGGLPWRL